METIALDASTPKRKTLTDNLTEKKDGYLKQKYGKFKLKTGRAYRSR